MSTTIFILLALASLIFLFIKMCRRPSNFPPGPPKLPIVGSIPFLSGDFLQSMKTLRSKYGKIFGFYSFNVPTVVVADFELYREMANREEFNHRRIGGAFDDLRYPDQHGQMRGVMFANDWEWREQRRFCTRCLRDGGFGKSAMEDIIGVEVKKTVAMIGKECHLGPMSLHDRLNVAIVNALWKLISGETLEYDDPRLKEVVRGVDRFMSATGTIGIINFYPLLKHVIPGISGYNNALNAFDIIRKIIVDAIEKHEINTNDEPQDLIDSYLKAFKEAKDSDDEGLRSFNGERGMNNLIITVTDLFVAGSDTTVNTINWTIYYMSVHPERQTRLQAELDANKHRNGSWTERHYWPYLQAVVQEVHRITSLGFIGIPRVTNKDTSLGGYFIPKDTIMMPFIYDILHDSDYWTEPENFKPERFLDEQGEFVMDERCIPFGRGKRGCLGKPLAEMELFMFLQGLFSSFNFNLIDPDLKLEPKVGFILGCPEFLVQVKKRM